MFSSDKWFGAEAGFYNSVATQSLRFEPADNSQMTFTPSSAGNRKTWTFSTWFKRVDPVDSGTNYGGGISEYIFNQFTGTDNFDSCFVVRIGGTEASNNDRIEIGAFSIRWLRCSPIIRDVSSWYHLVVRVDTTQASASNRLRVYLNGIETSYDHDDRSQITQDADLPVNASLRHNIGDYESSNAHNLSCYLADTHLIDGSSYDPTYFGEFKNGIWIAIKYSGSYGNQGWHLEYKQTGVGTGASNTIGADTSGNNNHWTSSGIVASDCNMPDSPENNFCTLHPQGRRYGQSYVGTFSEGNLKVASGGNATHVYGTMSINQIASQGGVYFEIRLDSQDTSRTYIGVNGVMGSNKNSSSNGASYSFPIKGLLRPSGHISAYFNTDTDGSGSTDLSSHNSVYSNGDIVGVAILSDGKTFFHKNGTYLDDSSGNVGNPSTGANPIGTIDLTKGDFVAYVGYNSTFTVNFGGDSTFSGQESSGGNSDANGIGDFKYAVPTNCLAICTSNMAEPTIGPNSDTQAEDHHGTLTYTSDGNGVSIVSGGNDNNGTAIGGEINFKPDWVWIKRRNGAAGHMLQDSSRGSTKRLRSDNTDQEITASTAVTSFDTNGFTLGTEGGVNTNTGTYVAWNWKANGGTTSSNSTGSITSTVQANTTAGFSIVLYTGTGASSATIGHGLGAVPKQIWVKNRDAAYNWKVYHAGNTTAPETDYLVLDTNDATVDAASHWNDTAPTSTVFSIGSSNALIRSGDDFVAYCFAEIEGYSKFGKYTAISSSATTPNHDGSFIYLGFRPAYFLIKRTSQSGEWNVHDNARSPINPMLNFLLPNATNAEVTSESIEFLSNGVKLRSASGYFDDPTDASFIYMAFAEAPFKFANAR